jgi:hypothetical protein
VDDVAIALEHVDLLNGLNGLDIQLLERLLELLVIAAGPGRRALDLSPRCSLATISSHVRIPVQVLHGGRVDRSIEQRGSRSLVPRCTYPSRQAGG